MAVYFVVDSRDGVLSRLRVVSGASSAAGLVARPAGKCGAWWAHDPDPRSAGGSYRARRRCKRATSLGFALLAIGTGVLASLAGTPITVTAAITLSVVSALGGVRLAFGAKLTNELISWAALAVAVAGLVFAVTSANTGRHETGPAHPVRSRAPNLRSH